MPDRFDTVSFLSDYGIADEFVGVVKSVIRNLAPHAVVVDLTHGIAPYDVRGASLALARAVQYLVPGVVLAVVDPGVGSERRAVAVEVADEGSVFVGPDNGLLASAVAMTGGATRAVALTDPAFQLPAPGPTFAGRDVFAPAVAHLCNGVDLAELGEPVEPDTLLPGVLPLTRHEDGAVVAEVLWVDRYGNVQLNVDADELLGLDDPVSLSFHDRVHGARRADSYSAIPAGAVGLVVDAYGLISIAANRHSAAADLGLDVGDSVTFAAGSDAGGADGSASPVALRPDRRPS